MNRSELSRELHATQAELERIERALGPLAARREMLRRRVAALEVLIRPEEPADEGLLLAIEEGEQLSRASMRRDVQLGSRALGHFGRDSRPDSVTRYPDGSMRMTEIKAYSGSGPVGQVDAAVVIAAILEEAGRPLHREDIYWRGQQHPLGPLNRNTLISRLSRDGETFRSAGDERSGYWALKSWPPRRIKVPDNDRGRAYAESLTQLERQRQLAIETSQRGRRLRDQRSALEHEIMAVQVSDEADMARRTRLQEELAAVHAAFDAMSSIAQKQRFIARHAWESALAAREALGDEADKYPGLPEPPPPAVDPGLGRTASIEPARPFADAPEDRALDQGGET
ncbi:MAG TPA: hypothetical protein VGK17_05260 [Propionicimonas sp.]|jgi:hypothetical protein